MAVTLQFPTTGVVVIRCMSEVRAAPFVSVKVQRNWQRKQGSSELFTCWARGLGAVRRAAISSATAVKCVTASPKRACEMVGG